MDDPSLVLLIVLAIENLCLLLEGTLWDCF